VVQSPEITSHWKVKCYGCQTGRVSVSIVSVWHLLFLEHATIAAIEVISEHFLLTMSSDTSKTAAVLPLLASKQRKTHANDWMSTDALVSCPDPNCPSVLKIRRTGERMFSRAETTIVGKEGNSGNM